MMATEAEQRDCYETALKVARDAGKVRIKATHKPPRLSLSLKPLITLTVCLL